MLTHDDRDGVSDGRRPEQYRLLLEERGTGVPGPHMHGIIKAVEEAR